jgi:hypothetical protein
MWNAIGTIIYQVLRVWKDHIIQREVLTYEGSAKINNDITRDDLLDKYGRLSKDSDSADSSCSDTGKSQ